MENRSSAQNPSNASSNSLTTILEELPEAMSSVKTQAPPSVLYLWGGGVTTPKKLPLLQQDSDVVQVSTGRTMTVGVTASGRLIVWEPAKDCSIDCVGGRASPTNMLVPRFLEGQSGVNITQVSCGDMFTACLTGKYHSV